MKRKHMLLLGIGFGLAVIVTAGYMLFCERDPVRPYLPPLLKAATYGDIKTVKRILDANPEAINQSASNGSKAIHWAMLDGHKEVFYEIMKRGYPINDPNLFLYLVDPKTAPEMLTYMLEHGADPNITIGEGHTPLNMAVNNGQDELIDILLDHGARVDLKDARGENAIDIVNFTLAFTNTPNTIWRREANPSEDDISKARAKIEARKARLLAAQAEQNRQIDISTSEDSKPSDISEK